MHSAKVKSGLVSSNFVRAPPDGLLPDGSRRNALKRDGVKAEECEPSSTKFLQSQILYTLLGSRFVEHVQHLHRIEGSHLAQQFGDFGVLVIV